MTKGGHGEQVAEFNVKRNNIVFTHPFVAWCEVISTCQPRGNVKIYLYMYIFIYIDTSKTALPESPEHLESRDHFDRHVRLRRRRFFDLSQIYK